MGAGKVRLSAHVDTVTREQVRLWTVAWQRTHDQLLAAARDAARTAAETGHAANPSAYLTARLQASLSVLGDQLRELGKREGVRISGLVEPAVTIAAEVQRELARSAGISWNMPQERALRAIVQRTGDTIASDYIKLTAEAEEQLRISLVRGIAAGQGPREVARQLVAATNNAATAAALASAQARLGADATAEAMVEQVRGAFGGGLARANNLVRTELLDASRMATRESYLANPGLVLGWRWLSTLSERTCPACWAMHNTVHKPEEHLEGHQQCRCTQVPILVGDDELDARTGLPLDDLGSPDAAFAKLSAAKQLQVLGPKRLEAWQQGTPLRAFAQRQERAGWRPAHYVTPLRDLPTPPGRRPHTPTPGPDELRPPAPPKPEREAWAADVDAALARLPADRSLIAHVPGTDERLAELEAGVARLQEKAAANPATWGRALKHLQGELDQARKGVLDLAADGGPGEVAMEHLAAVRKAGAILRDAVEGELAGSTARAERDAVEAALEAARKGQAEAQAQLARRRVQLGAELQQVEEARLGRQLTWEEAMRLRDAARHSTTDDEMAKLLADVDRYARDRAIAEGQVRVAAERAAVELRDAVLRILSRYRTMGRAGTIPMRTATRELEAAMRHAEGMYPQAWLDQVASRGRELTVGKAKRGYQQGWTIKLSDDGGRQIISTAPAMDRVATHELGHLMEQEVPGVKLLEWAYLWARTSEPAKRAGGKRVRAGVNAKRKLRDLIPHSTYAAREVARADTFPNAYTGKLYGEGPRDFYELLTTFMESATAGSRYTDDDGLAWLLGVLAAL